MFSVSYPTKQALDERRIITTCDIPESVRQMVWDYPSMTERTTDKRHTTPEEWWHDLTTGQPSQLPIEVIAAEALVPSITRKSNGNMLPHELTHGMRSEKRGVSKRLASMLEKLGEMFPGAGNVLHIERQMFTTDVVRDLYGGPSFIISLFHKTHIKCLKGIN